MNRKIRFYRDKSERKLAWQVARELREIREREQLQRDTLIMLNGLVGDRDYEKNNFNEIFK